MLRWRYIDSIHALARMPCAATDRIWITIRNYNPPAIYNAHNVCMYTVAFYEPSHFYVNRAILDRRERPPPFLLLSYSANSDRRPNLFRANAVNRKGHLARRDGITRAHVARGIFLTEQTSNMKGDPVFFPRISVDRFGVTGTLAGYLSGDVDDGILLVRPRFIYSPPQKHNDRNHIIFVRNCSNIKLSEQYRLIWEMYHYFFSAIEKHMMCF